MSEPHAGDEPSRFRVNRIQSSQLHNAPPVVGTYISTTIPEDLPMTINVGGCLPNNMDSSNDVGDHYPNQNMRPRRSSLAQGLGGGRKKSVSLPKEFDYLAESDATVYGKNFAYYTREALPNMDNYKNILGGGGNMGRPTLDELRSEAMYAKKEPQAPEAVGTGVKFGWIEGVLVRCLLNIW